MENAIFTQGITKKFADKTAVSSLDLQVSRGTVFGFLGPNGAGKTTTIKLLLGLLRPTSGTASVLGADPWTQGRIVRKSAGVLFEEDGLYPLLSGPENMRLFGALYGLSSSEVDAEVKRLENWLELSGDQRLGPVRKLSRGTSRKWGLCRTLLTHPDVLFLDEPTSGLDPIAAREVRNRISNLAAEQGTTVFMSTHNLDEAMRLCSRVGVLVNGRLAACDKPENLRPAASDFVIRYGGDPVAPSDFPGCMGQIQTCADGKLTVHLNDPAHLAGYIARLCALGRPVYEAACATNPLESMIGLFSKENAETGL